MTGEQMLKHAAALVANRRKTYGDPAVSMAVLAKRWSTMLGRPITPAQVVLCLIDLKLTRLGYDPAHQDFVVDLAGYAAVLHEVTR